MTFNNPLAGLENFPAIQLFQTLIPDFILAFTFFTAMTYAVLSRRFDHQRSAVAMSAAIGLALSIGLVWWEYDRGWSVRNLGPLAIGFVVIVLAMILFQAIRQTGGSWAGAGIAFGASILVAWILGFDWPIAPAVVQALAIVGLIGGIIAFMSHGHRRGPFVPFVPAANRAESGDLRHDYGNLYQDEHVGARLSRGLTRVRQEAHDLSRHPENTPTVVDQLRRILPAEGWLTERLARLRAKAHLVRNGHLARIEELRHLEGKLSPEAQKQAQKELAERYQELKLDKRMERLDAAVAENERRIQQLTQEAREAGARNDVRKTTELLSSAENLQKHNGRLFETIDRTERKLVQIAQEIDRQNREAEVK